MNTRILRVGRICFRLRDGLFEVQSGRRKVAYDAVVLTNNDKFIPTLVERLRDLGAAAVVTGDRTILRFKPLASVTVEIVMDNLLHHCITLGLVDHTLKTNVSINLIRKEVEITDLGEGYFRDVLECPDAEVAIKSFIEYSCDKVSGTMYTEQEYI